MSFPIGIVGGGAFGRALAMATSRAGRSVILLSRVERAILGGGTMPIRSTASAADLAECELIFVAVPSAYVEAVGCEIGRHLDGSHLIVHISRGIVNDDLQTVSELLRSVTPVRRVGALAGPLVASALAEGRPGGAIVGTMFPEVVDAVRETLGGPTMRIYSTDDVLGVELASVFVGIVSVSLGYAKAAGLGPSTLSVLGSRSMAEATQVGRCRGALQQTFAGLAGTGDLLAAVADDERPELAFGTALQQGQALTDVVAASPGYVEAIAAARRIEAYAERHSLEVPMVSALLRLTDGTESPASTLTTLMKRPAGRERY